MNILMKLKPFMSEQYALEQNYLRIPVLFTYESRDGIFTHNITDGLPIIGKVDIETRFMKYSIGNNCTIEQLTEFINSLSKKIPCGITFSETDDYVNSVEYDPSEEVWRHKTGSKMAGIGSTMNIKITDETIKHFCEALDNYRKFAFMQIEGHKKLYSSE